VVVIVVVVVVTVAVVAVAVVVATAVIVIAIEVLVVVVVIVVVQVAIKLNAQAVEGSQFALYIPVQFQDWLSIARIQECEIRKVVLNRCGVILLAQDIYSGRINR